MMLILLGDKQSKRYAMKTIHLESHVAKTVFVGVMSSCIV